MTGAKNMAMTALTNQRSSGRVLQGCLIAFLVLGVGGCGALVFGIMSLFKNTIPFQESVERAQDNPGVVEILGRPINPGFFVSGSISINNDDGTADISIPVSGPNGSGTLVVTGVKDDGEWSYSRMEFRDGDSSTRIDLLPALEPSPTPTPALTP